MNSLIASNCCGQNGLAFTSGTRKILVRTGNGDEKRKDNYHFLNLKKDKDLASQQFMDSPERKLLVRHGSSVKSMRRTFEMFELKTVSGMNNFLPNLQPKRALSDHLLLKFSN